MNSFFLTLAGVFIAVLTLAFAVPHFIDWNSYRHVFEAQASKLVGRNVFVGGDVRLRLLPTPLLRFGEVRIADAKGQIDTPFVQAESFTIWLSTPPLLSGTLVAREIEIEKPVVNLKLNAQGEASWRDMGPSDDAIAFMPSEVALDSVKLTDATLAIVRGPTRAPIKFENVTGELSARSLDGPFKFAGRFNHEERTREIKFSTGKLQENGELRLKSVVRDQEGTENIALDGALQNASSRPVFQGDLVARFGAPEIGPEKHVPVEVRANLNAGLSQARVENLEVTLRKNDTPQVLRGRLDVGWLGGLDLAGTITSRWIDLDAFAAETDASSKDLESTVLALLRQALGQVANIERGRLQVGIEKAGLAGEVVSDVAGKIDLDNGVVSLSDLSMVLPGVSTLRLTGRLSAQDEKPSFAGQAGIEGSNLGKLLTWAGAPAGQLAASDDAEFALNTVVQAGGGRLLLENANGQLFGSAFDGGLRYSWGERPKFSLDLKSQGLDFERLFGRYATVGSLLSMAERTETDTEASGESDTSDARWMSAGNADIDLRVTAAKLPGVTEADMAVKVSLARGNFSIDRLTLKSAEGLLLRAEGGLNGLASKPKGRIMLTADAAAPEGIGSLWSILDLPARDLMIQRAERLAPMRIAIAIESKRDQADGLEARVGGSFDKSNIELLAEYTGSIAAIDKGGFKLTGTVGNAGGAALMRQLFPDLDAAKVKPFEKSRGEVTLKAEGEMRGTVDTRVELATGDFRWSIDGATSTAGERATFEGASDVQAGDVEPLLSLAGFNLGPRAELAPISAKAKLNISDAGYRFGDIDGTLSGSRFSGSLSLEKAEQGPLIRATIEADNANAGQVLRPLLAWHRAPVGRRKARRAATRRPSAGRAAGRAAIVDSRWAERGFDLEAISRLQGNVSLKAKRLQLAGALAMSDAILSLTMAGGKIDINKLDGNFEGGKAKITGQLERRENGLALTAQARLEGADLERISALGTEQPLAAGTANLQLAVNGIGRTPKGLASSLGGAGSLTTANTVINGFSPATLQTVARSEIEAEISRARSLPARVAEAFANTRFDVEPATIAIEIRDGVAQTAKTVFDSEDGDAAMTSFLELATMKLDSEWNLAVKPREEVNEDLKVDLVFAGPVTQFGRIAPRIKTKSLARYITVQRIAREVELKQLSEERRQEALAAAKQAREAEAAAREAKAKEAEAAAAQRAAAKQAEEAEQAKAAQAARDLAEQQRQAAERQRQAAPAAAPARRPIAPPIPARRRAPAEQAPAQQAVESSPWATRSEPAGAGAAAAPDDSGTETDQAAIGEDQEPETPPRRTSRRPRSSSFEDSGFSGYSN